MFTHKNLEKLVGKLPNGSREQALRKIREWKNKGEQGLEYPSRRFWDAMTTGSLKDAIVSKSIWPAFEKLLDVNKSNFTHHWKDFGDLRNTKFHSNEPLTPAHLEVGIGATKLFDPCSQGAEKNSIH